MPASLPVVVCVHGYPDHAGVWSGVAERLGGRYRVVTYDVRGAGRSERPDERGGYRLEQLTDDFRSVLGLVAPDEPVHLIGHDWGGIQAWHFATEPELADRIASLTTISGPSLDHAGRWLRRGLRPGGGFRDAIRQQLHSYYIGFFLLPVLPELAWRSGVLDRAVRTADAGYRRSLEDKLNGLNLYRANMVGRLGRPSGARTTEVPAQVLAPVGDAFVTPALQLEAPEPYTGRLFRRRLAGDHWMLTGRPDVIADAAAELIDLVEHGTAAPRLRRAELHRPDGRRPRGGRARTFGGSLVLVTGGGSGIGRETAYAFARAGADVLVADIDEGTAKETAAEVQRLGRKAEAYQLDVADLDAWDALAARIGDEHGGLDVLVNNAGIGMAGPFLSTSRTDWDRIIGINLRSVIQGSRLFADQWVAQGRPGRIVNIASAAAYSPSKTYPAYATTKAAVLMLSECLTAELADHHITVTAICPGFIDTNISRTTTHVGLDSDAQAAKQDRAVRSYHRRNYPPARAARLIVSAAAAGTPIKYVTPEAVGFLVLDRALPGAQRAIAKIDLTEL